MTKLAFNIKRDLFKGASESKKPNSTKSDSKVAKIMLRTIQFVKSFLVAWAVYHLFRILGFSEMYSGFLSGAAMVAVMQQIERKFEIFGCFND
ncbi:MAG: hypothetical protein JJU02_02140 [Cryomorphaceae bacterium]|nr:hypothetical protein [Cryomorphaceae bacterium]